jgi:hypothetical protein
MTDDTDWPAALQAQWQQQEDARRAMHPGPHELGAPAGIPPVAGRARADFLVALALSRPLPVALPSGFAQQMAALVRPASAAIEWALAAATGLLLLAAGAVALHLNPGLPARSLGHWLQDPTAGWLTWLAVAMLVGTWPSHQMRRTGAVA